MIRRIPIFLLLIFSLFSCNNTGDTNNKHEDDHQTVMVTFFNSSSYKVIVHRDNFYGPIIAEVNDTSRETIVPVRLIDNKTTIFSFEYIRYPINDDIKNEFQDLFVSYDTDIQYPIELKADKPETIKIPQPINPICKSALLIIINKHNLPIRLRYSMRSIEQTNNTLLIEPNAKGVYKLDNISNTGELCQYYNISTTFDETYFENFASKNGIYLTKNAFIFWYTFDGSIIEKYKEPQTLIFN